MGSVASRLSGNPSSDPAPPDPPAGVRKLNDSLWELYSPEGVPTMEVIFFHGLQLSDYRQAFWTTWLSRSRDPLIWPQEWLGPDLRNARILSVSYDTSARRTKTSGNVDTYQIIENLIQDIITSSSGNVGQNCEVILVGHSLGGLIIKELLVEVKQGRDQLDPNDKLGKFLRNLRGIFYYSTPHAGSELADYAARVNQFPFANINMPIIEFLKVLSEKTARINGKYSEIISKLPQVAVRSMGETHKTFFAGLSAVVVKEASARAGLPQHHYSVAANHFDVCKPEDQISNIYTFLRDMCNTVQNVQIVERQAELEQLR